MPDVPQPGSRGLEAGPVPAMGPGGHAMSLIRLMGLRSGLAGRLQLSGLLIASGLGIEVVTLYWNHPVSFLLFLCLASLLVGVGMLLYLWSVVRRSE